MKTAELFQSPLTTGVGKKRKKLPKQPDPWFFTWAGPGGYVVPGGGSGEAGEGDGGGVSESVSVAKSFDELPERIFLAKSYYMQKHPDDPTSDWRYDVLQFLPTDDGLIARFFIQQSHAAKLGRWLFSPNRIKFKVDPFDTTVSPSSTFDENLIKRFCINRLIELGVLPPRNSDAN